MDHDPPVRVGLLLTDACLFAARLLPDGQRRLAQALLPATSRFSPTASAAQKATAQADLASAMTQVLHSLFPADDPQKRARLDLVLCNVRALHRLHRHDLPGVALVPSTGLEDALQASLCSPAPMPRTSPADGTRDVQDPAFLWVGDAAEILPQCSGLDALCPPSQVLSTPLRLTADGQVLQDASDQDIAMLCQTLKDRSLSSAAVVLLHSPRNPQPERDLALSLRSAGIVGVASADGLTARRGAEDERLRTRAAVLSAALSPGCLADLQGLQAGVDPTHSPRWFVLRSDGSCGPVEQVPAWQQLLAPLAAGLLGAARQAEHVSMESDRFLCWLSQVAGPQESTASGSPPTSTSNQDEQEAPLALAAVCSRNRAGGPHSHAPHAASCLGIPCDVPALAARIVAGATDGDSALQELAAPYGAVLHGTSSDSASPAGAGAGAVAVERSVAMPPMSPLPALPVLRMDFADAALWGTLRSRAIFEATRSLFTEASGAQQSGLLAKTLQHLQSGLFAFLAPAVAAATHGGVPSDAEWSAELRYRGQAGVLTLRGIGPGGPAATPASDLVVRFVSEHQRVYGFSRPECPVELVQLSLRVRL